MGAPVVTFDLDIVHRRTLDIAGRQGSILEYLEAELLRRNETKSETDRLRQAYSLLRERLHKEIDALTRRGNLNLAIGSVTTIAAVIILAFIALKAPEKVADWHDVLPQYALRISLAIFVEVFSFFFLRLYRTTLLDIKYFQNELTNVDLKIIAIEFSMLKDGDLAKGIVVSLLATERNFILKQGESTVEAERLRLEGQNTREVVEGLSALAKTIKSQIAKS